MDGRWLIRPASASDVPAIAAAERTCFSDPWSARGLTELFDNETTIGLVGGAEGPEFRLAGYVFGRSIADQGEILNLAVLPGLRGRGLGGLLLDRVLARLENAGARSVFLEVREANEAAKRLYQSRGFRAAGLRAGYYRDPPEDALVLRLDLKLAMN